MAGNLDGAPTAPYQCTPPIFSFCLSIIPSHNYHLNSCQMLRERESRVIRELRWTDWKPDPSPRVCFHRENVMWTSKLITLQAVIYDPWLKYLWFHYLTLENCCCYGYLQPRRLCILRLSGFISAHSKNVQIRDEKGDSWSDCWGCRCEPSLIFQLRNTPIYNEISISSKNAYRPLLRRTKF